MKNLILSFALLLFLALTGCSRRTVDPVDTTTPDRLVPQFGSAKTFDIATWNIEHFPMQGSSTIINLAQLITDMDLDLIGIEEIDESDSFQALLDLLPNYAGVVSQYPTDRLKLGIIYKKDMITISTPTQIYVGDWYAFPRPPLTTYVQVKKQGDTVFDFTLFVLHLKAFGDAESQDRRREACQKLKTYIDDQILSSADKDVIALGDWNDRLEDTGNNNVFQVFLDDTSNYRFLSKDLIGESSYPGSNSLIDHILITKDAGTEYSGGNINVLTLDFEYADYSTLISDHRPVLARFPIF